jgi:hypothetical protein
MNKVMDGTFDNTLQKGYFAKYAALGKQEKEFGYFNSTDIPNEKIAMFNKALLDLGHKIILWLSSKQNRMRLQGARIEVAAFIISRKPDHSILLGQSPYHEMWMPPQEGVRLSERLEDALYKCLRIECGLNLPKDPIDLKRLLYLRSIKYLGTLDLPPVRWGERPVADDVTGTPLESIQLKRKAYWKATLLLANQSDINPKADGKELIRLKWFTFEEARLAILETNHANKAELLTHGLEEAERDLKGATRFIRYNSANG